MSISLSDKALDLWRKQEYPEETFEARGEHVDSAHIQGGDGIRTLTPEVRGKPADH